MSRRRKTSRSTATRADRTMAMPRWRQILLLLTVVPMAIGIVLFVAAWADWIFLGTQTGQTIAGALLALLGFAASNALQERWLLAGGWTALAGAVWLMVGHSNQTWAPWLGAAVAVIALILLGIMFVGRYREIRTPPSRR